MDFGYPQATEQKILKEFITQEGYRTKAQPRPPTTLTNAVSWRSEGIVHKKNEIFLDVVEKLNLLMSKTGKILSSEIIGRYVFYVFDIYLLDIYSILFCHLLIIYI